MKTSIVKTSVMKTRKAIFTMTLAVLVVLSVGALGATSPTGRYDQQIQQAVSQKMLSTKHLQGVYSSVEDGIVSLSGSVNLYQDKLEAAKKIKKVANLSGVRNDIVVAGENVSDSQLQEKLA